MRRPANALCYFNPALEAQSAADEWARASFSRAFVCRRFHEDTPIVLVSTGPVFAAHRSNIREWYFPPGPNSWPLNIQPLVRFRARCVLSLRCGPLATYLRVKLPARFDDLKMHSSA